MSHFFKFPVNYRYGRSTFTVSSQSIRSMISTVSDNDYRTYSSETRYVFETHGDARDENTQVTHIFLKGSGITRYSVSVPTGKGSGVGLTNRVVPASGVVNGIQHDLAMLGPLDVTEVELQLTGVDIRLYEVMLLDSLIDIDAVFVEIEPARTDRGSINRSNIRGELYTVPGLAGRYKWDTNLTAFFNGGSPSADDFMRALESNANFTFSEDFDEYPDRVYPATLAESTIGIEYVGRLFEQRRVRFTLSEI